VDDELTGADAVHRQLVRWLERFGDRSGLGSPDRMHDAGYGDRV
jgi:hypothetical protein